MTFINSDTKTHQELPSIAEDHTYDIINEFDPYSDIEIYIESDNGPFVRWNKMCDKLLNDIKGYCIPIMALLMILCIISSIVLTFGGFIIAICVALIYLIANYQIVRWISIFIVCIICFVIFINYSLKFIKKLLIYLSN